MNEKKKPTATPKPAHVVRSGEVSATITHRQSNAGFTYYDFTLGRHWTSMATGKEAHGTSFFDRNEDDLIRVVREAVAWIRAKVYTPPAGPQWKTGVVPGDAPQDHCQPTSKDPVQDAQGNSFPAKPERAIRE